MSQLATPREERQEPLPEGCPLLPAEELSRRRDTVGTGSGFFLTSALLWGPLGSVDMAGPPRGLLAQQVLPPPSGTASQL